jgi:hypothetical protein
MKSFGPKLAILGRISILNRMVLLIKDKCTKYIYPLSELFTNYVSLNKKGFGRSSPIHGARVDICCKASKSLRSERTTEVSWFPIGRSICSLSISIHSEPRPGIPTDHGFPQRHGLIVY